MFKKIYEEITSNSWFMIKLSSYESTDEPTTSDDINKPNIFTFWCCNKYRQWLLPFSWIKPVYDYTSKNNIRFYVPREYSITKTPNHICIRGGMTESFLYNKSEKKTWIYYFRYPWVTATRTIHELLNLDGTVYEKEHKCCSEKSKKQPFRTFKMKDYDDEEVEVIAKLEHSVYTYGESSLMKWIMKWFKKPEDNYYLSLDFITKSGDGVGKGKHDWKGGMVGHAMKLLNKSENWEVALRRYANENNLTYEVENV